MSWRASWQGKCSNSTMDAFERGFACGGRCFLLPAHKGYLAAQKRKNSEYISPIAPSHVKRCKIGVFLSCSSAAFSEYSLSSVKVPMAHRFG